MIRIKSKSKNKSNKKSIKKIDKIWEHILNSCENYKDYKNIIITSKFIKGCRKTWTGEKNQFEPRLLCKFDKEENRPQIFKDNNLYLISIKNGIYLLTKYNIYHKLEYLDIEIIKIKKDNSSLVLKIGNSEMSYIDNIRYSGIFDKYYLHEPIKYSNIFGGRHRCSFQTFFDDECFDIEGCQFETDSCYETENKIIIIEGKITSVKKELNSFNIRQLYFPFRKIYDSIKDKKEIICLFINIDKDNIIHIWNYKFCDYLKMNSIKLINYKKFKFID